MGKWFNRFKRALCCFPRKRRHSDFEYELLNSGNFVYNTTTRRRSEQTANDWNPWDDARRSIDQHIAVYRQKLFLQNTQPTKTETTTEPDYFQDMTPTIVKQTKVLLQRDGDIPTNFSRLEAASAIAVDLEDWTDGDQPGDVWEALDDKQINNLIRARRKELRAQQKQQMSINLIEKQSILLAHRIDAMKNQPIGLADRLAAKRQSI